jgi:hypothetical protein
MESRFELARVTLPSGDRDTGPWPGDSIQCLQSCSPKHWTGHRMRMAFNPLAEVEIVCI